MDFGFREERGKIPFSYSSSSSSASSSSQYKTANLMPLLENYQYQPRGFELMAANDEEVVRSSGDFDGHGSSGSFCVEKEHMFDKVVTPSDVGKLNRLVIPKQHAENYFPLDSSTNEKGLILNFEDRNGKPWRFRYSYWNSSQSYVMTKGWSRFVKEKKLYAGDIVSFQRGVGEEEKYRLYIDWRRRPEAPEPAAHSGYTALIPHQFAFHHHRHHSIPCSPLLLHPIAAATPMSRLNNNLISRGGASCYGGIVSPHPPPYSSNGSILYLRSVPLGPQGQHFGTVHVPHGDGVEPVVFDSVPVVHQKAASKRLRLFGVNMECPTSESDGGRETASHLPSGLSSSNPQSPLHLSLYNGTHKDKPSTMF